MEISVPLAQGLDVSNLIKDVLNFGKYVPRVPKCVPRWGSAPNHFLKIGRASCRERV